MASERTVVISEREGSENEPLFRLGEAVQEAAFDVHPYHHEVIGYLADLKAMQRDDLYGYYRTYYRPNNAVLAVAGDFDTCEMLSRIKDLYENIPPGELPPRPSIVEPPSASERKATIEEQARRPIYRWLMGSEPRQIRTFSAFTVLDSLLTGPDRVEYVWRRGGYE